MKLNTSISSGFFHELSPEQAIDELLAGGFNCTELDMGHGAMLLQRSGSPESIGRELSRYAEDRGFSIPQGHLPEPDLCTVQGVDELKASLELFHGAGVRAAVLHANGLADRPYEEQLTQRARSIRELVKHIEGTDMVICLENLASKPMVRTAEGINTLIDASGGGAHLGICLDIGHLHRCNCHGWSSQSSTAFIETAGSRLKALHIHDNLGDTDDHLFPFLSKGLDWKEFMQALAANGYRDLYNLELPGEAICPLEVRRIKLRHAKAITEFLLSNEFIA